MGIYVRLPFIGIDVFNVSIQCDLQWFKKSIPLQNVVLKLWHGHWYSIVVKTSLLEFHSISNSIKTLEISTIYITCLLKLSFIGLHDESQMSN